MLELALVVFTMPEPLTFIMLMLLIWLRLVVAVPFAFALLFPLFRETLRLFTFPVMFMFPVLPIDRFRLFSFYSSYRIISPLTFSITELFRYIVMFRTSSFLLSSSYFICCVYHK